MKLSIIVVNYNTKLLTSNCLRSIDRHPFSEKFEVILVDNGSSDESVDYFKSYKPRNYRFRFIANNNNLGFSRANNIGIAQSRGNYILLLNSDTIVHKNSLDGLVDFALHHTEAGVIAPRLLNKDGSLQASVFRLPTLVRTIEAYWLGHQGILDKYYPENDEPCSVEAVVGAAMLITPQARSKVGILDERYFMYYEDLEYCRRVLKAGLKIYYIPSVKITHLHGKSGENIADKSEQWKRLIPGSKQYHGKVVHYLRWFVMRTSQLFNVEK